MVMALLVNELQMYWRVKMNVLHISRSMGQGGAQKVVCQLCEDVKANHFIASCGGVHVESLKKLVLNIFGFLIWMEKIHLTYLKLY